MEWSVLYRQNVVIMGFRFFIEAIVFIFVFDSRHYARLWLGAEVSYSSWKFRLLRAFFWLALAGSSIQLVTEIINRRPGITDLGFSLVDSLALLSIFLIFDVLFRWRFGRRKW